ncbi:hypothetical protein M378DRAFT_166856, partial [Amanita muscaria Koide BX008]
TNPDIRIETELSDCEVIFLLDFRSQHQLHIPSFDNLHLLCPWFSKTLSGPNHLKLGFTNLQ